MATPFENIYDKFFLQIGDDAKAKLLKMPIVEMNSLLYSMLEESIVSFKKCKKLQVNIDKVNNQFLIDLDLEEQSILALGIVVVWLKPQVMRLQNLKQSLGDRDFKKTSNWQTLNSLSSLKKDTEKELSRKITDYSYNPLSTIVVKK